jgi:hypothetical protein
MQSASDDGQALANSQHVEDTDEYSDFAEDPEALEIINQILLTAATQQQQDHPAPIEVTDIEDYEGPRGVRLPKVPNFEETRRYELDGSAVGIHTKEILREENSMFYDMPS